MQYEIVEIKKNENNFVLEVVVKVGEEKISYFQNSFGVILDELEIKKFLEKKYGNS